MSPPRSKHLSIVSAEILAEVAREETIKQAELEALRSATPTHVHDLSQLLAKVAEDVRGHSADVTYEDLSTYVEGRL